MYQIWLQIGVIQSFGKCFCFCEYLRSLVSCRMQFCFGHSFILRLHRFLNHSLNFRTELGLNRDHVVYRDYSGCTIERLSLRGIREVDKFKPALVRLKIGYNDLCSMDVQWNGIHVFDKLVEFTAMLRGQGVRRDSVFQILHSKPPTKPGDFQLTQSCSILGLLDEI